MKAWSSLQLGLLKLLLSTLELAARHFANMSTITDSRTDGRLRDGLWIKRIPSVYSPTQIVQWLSKIDYPKKDLSEDDVSTFETSLENLCLLIRLQVVRFPFENTPMHYTRHRIMDISPEAIFQRLVVEGKGCYCFGLNRLFFEMIRGLGYRVLRFRKN
ncbi:hypothetical protein VKT23_011118 [Stygiomarasmius scandens]|uniref:Arylamine N-acetyltransferase n=1 Tax=Marasmiellus scandens TaxID=2682957 RepID=A0ABR1J9W6_9AGAR